MDPAVNLAEIAGLCPARLTGADLYALCADALLTAIHRIVDSRRDGGGTSFFVNHYTHSVKGKETGIIVTNTDFHEALGRLTPSVSEAELLYYKQAQQKFSL